MAPEPFLHPRFFPHQTNRRPAGDQTRLADLFQGQKRQVIRQMRFARRRQQPLGALDQIGRMLVAGRLDFVGLACFHHGAVTAARKDNLSIS